MEACTARATAHRTQTCQHLHTYLLLRSSKTATMPIAASHAYDGHAGDSIKHLLRVSAAPVGQTLQREYCEWDPVEGAETY